MNSKHPKIYILILNYNSWANTIECLESIFKSDYSNYQIIVIDNDSSDNSLEYIRAWAEGKLSVWISPAHPLRNRSFPPEKKPLLYLIYSREKAENQSNILHSSILDIEGQTSIYPNSKDLSYLTTSTKLILIQTGKNLGFAGGNNVALRMLLSVNSQGMVLLLNPDMILNRNSLQTAIDFVNSDKPQKVIYGFTVKAYSESDKILFLGGGKINHYTGTIKFIKEAKKLDELSFISGGALFTDITSFKVLGLLPEEYFLYWEETDWCTKAIRQSYTLKVCRDAVCYHKGGMGMHGASSFAEYYYTKGSLKYHSKYYPQKIAFIKAANVLRIAKRIIKMRWNDSKSVMKAIKDYKNTN